jgi:PPOX class probable F420-dependent enzyme
MPSSSPYLRTPPFKIHSTFDGVNIERAEAIRRCAAARLARLATVAEDGQPHLVPVSFAVCRDAVVTAVDAKPKTSPNLKRLRNIMVNPRVSILVDHYDDEDWSALWWVRGDGNARIVNAGHDDFAEAIEALAAKYHQYLQTPPAGPVIWIEISRWIGWAYS